MTGAGCNDILESLRAMEPCPIPVSDQTIRNLVVQMKVVDENQPRRSLGNDGWYVPLQDAAVGDGTIHDRWPARRQCLLGDEW